VKKHLLSLAALLLFAGGAQASSQLFVLSDVTYSNSIAGNQGSVFNCTGCGVGTALYSGVAGPGNIALTGIAWDFNAGGNEYSISFDATTTLAGSTTLTKLASPAPTCINVVGGVCTATNVRSGLGVTNFYTGIASNNVTTCTNNRCRVDNYLDVDGNLVILLKRALSESATSSASQLYTLTFTAVPLPAGVWLFGSALGLMGLARRKRA